MKYVLVTPPVQLRYRNGEPFKIVSSPGAEPSTKPITALDFVLDYICNDPKLGKGYEGLKRADRLEKIFTDVEEGDYAAVESADWKAVIEVLDAKEWGMPLITKQFLPFLDAWYKAEEKKPAVAEATAPAAA